MRTISTLLCALIMSVIPALAQFGPGVQITSSFMSQHELKAADLNGDTYLDLVFQNAGVIVWSRNLDGLGNFGPLDTLYLSFPQYPWQDDHYHGFDLRDVDLDGAIDVIIVDREDSAVVWLPNNGFGSFGPAQIVADLHGRGFLGSMICIDVMDSPFPDVVMNVEHAEKRMIYINDGGSFTTVDSIYAQMGGPMSPVLVAGDLDLNGYNDLVLEYYDGPARALLNSGGAGDSWTDNALGFASFSGQLQLIDVDRDGDLDAADAASDNTPIWAESFAANPGGFQTFVARYIGPPVPYEHTGWVGYLGCSNTASALWSSGPESNTLNWSLFDAQIQAFVPPLSWASEPGIILIRTADLNGDGAEDLILAHSDSILTWYPNLLPQSGSGLQVQLTPFDTLCTSVETYDLPDGLPSGGQWSGPDVYDNSYQPINMGSATLTYTVQDPITGCPASAAQNIVAIAEPTITLVSGVLGDECSVTPLQYSAAPSGGEWSGAADPTGYVDRSCDVRPLFAPVMYTYNAPNGGNCATEGDMFYLLPCQPINLGPDQQLCMNGDTLEVFLLSPSGDLQGFDSVAYAFGTVHGFFYPDHGPGTYQFTGFSASPGSCPGYDTLLVTVVPGPQPQILSTNLFFCANDLTGEVEMNMAGNFAGAVNGLDTAIGNVYPSLLDTGSHTFSFTVVDDNGCEGSLTDSVWVQSLPDVTLTVPEIVDVDGGVVSFNEGIPTGGWYVIDGVVTDTVNPIGYTVGTSFTVVYYYEDPATGCVGVDSASVMVEQITGVGPDKPITGFRMSPNPAHGNCQVWFSGSGPCTISILDGAGRSIQTRSAHRSPVLLELGSMAPGRYIINVEQPERIDRAILVIE